MEALAKFKIAIVEFDSTQGIIGSYAGLTAPRVSRGLTGEAPFDEQESQVLSETIDAMYALQATTNLPIDWRMIGKVRPHVESKRNELKDGNDPVIRTAYYVRTNLHNYFVRLRGDKSVVENMNYLQSTAFTDPLLARRCAELLKDYGVTARTDILTGIRRESTITKSLAELGFPAVTEQMI